MSSSGSLEGTDSPEDCDFSDEVLRYISAMLMEEEDLEASALQNPSDLQAAEKSFYDVIGERYPPTDEHYSTSYNGHSNEHYGGNAHGNFSDFVNTSSHGCSIEDNILGEYIASHEENVLIHGTQQFSFDAPNPTTDISQGPQDSPDHQAPTLYSGSQLVSEFMTGNEEASRFLPSNPNLSFNLNFDGLLSPEPRGGSDGPVIIQEDMDNEEQSSSGSRRKKNPYLKEINLEEDRRSKQVAVYAESTIEPKFSDEVLLSHAGQSKSPLSALQESLQNETKMKEQQEREKRGSVGRKGRAKKATEREEGVDLHTLLILCAQAVSANDQRTANEQLKQIRQHSSSVGDGNQRLAHYFANGLEARLAGAGSQIYKNLLSHKTYAVDTLKAYHLYVAACPFRKMTNFFSNRMIMKTAANSMRLHIIDFGIFHGFQWPTFFQRISAREGGAPKVRITAIDYPQPGFRPSDVVDDTGRRIAAYAERFNVPFEYNAIVKKWEAIQIEELKIDKDEVLAVNSLNVFHKLPDESVAENCTRNSVLNIIRKINPDIFILGVVNGTYNAPFFITRFREALFHFSSIFDMLETNVPRRHHERMLLEREFFAKMALNVIACEGEERVERPEPYKQWQIRQTRAGFRQLALDKEITQKVTHRVNSSYHKNFVIDKDGEWLLQGWKGRILYALSTWKPV